MEPATVLVLMPTCPGMPDSMLWKCSVYAMVNKVFAMQAESAAWTSDWQWTCMLCHVDSL